MQYSLSDNDYEDYLSQIVERYTNKFYALAATELIIGQQFEEYFIIEHNQPLR